VNLNEVCRTLEGTQRRDMNNSILFIVCATEEPKEKKSLNVPDILGKEVSNVVHEAERLCTSQQRLFMVRGVVAESNQYCVGGSRKSQSKAQE
jgi:hypothetical protein